MTELTTPLESPQIRTAVVPLPSTRFHWPLAIVVGLAIAFGVVLRLQLLNAASLWLDELWTLDAVSRSFKEMIGARLVSDTNPPLWTMTAWLWLRVVGTYDAAAERLLPMLLGLLAMVIPLAGAVRLRTLRPTLLVMSGIAALSLFPLQYSVELRSYSMLIALGTAATVAWAGLLTGELAGRWQWVFFFTLTGALAGFTHYYGNLLYLTELLVLIVLWARTRPRRDLRTLTGWASVSLLPVVAWLVLVVLVFQKFPNAFSADPPNLAVVQTWWAYAFGPVSNVVAGHGPGYAYPSGSLGVETLLFAGVTALILVAGFAAAARLRVRAAEATALVGVASVAAIGVGVAIAWIASILLPPSMTTRNLASLLPLLFLSIACAVTSFGSERTRWVSGAAAVGVWLLASVAFAGQYGIAALAPPWQTQAGYRPAVQALLSQVESEPSTTLIGLELPWGWHGEWDAAVRAQLGRPPAESSDPPPFAVRWILNASQLQAADLPASPLIAFTDANGADLFRSISEARPGCQVSDFGGPGYGVAEMLRCPGR